MLDRDASASDGRLDDGRRDGCKLRAAARPDGYVHLYQGGSPNDLTVGQASYSAQTKWWRLRPTTEGIAGDISADGFAWSPIGLARGTVGQVAFDFGAGVDTLPTLTPYPTVTFRNLNTCP